VTAATLFVARHAAVSVEGVCYGQSDVPTHVDARAAAAVVLEQLAREGVQVARVWASPWKRAREPAERVAAELGVPLAIDARIAELGFGQWEGRRYAELERDPAFVAWMHDWRESAPPGGERLAELLARVAAWRADVEASDEVALALTHAGVVRALRADARRVPYDTVVGERVTPLRVERVRQVA